MTRDDVTRQENGSLTRVGEPTRLFFSPSAQRVFSFPLSRYQFLFQERERERTREIPSDLRLRGIVRARKKTSYREGLAPEWIRSSTVILQGIRLLIVDVIFMVIFFDSRIEYSMVMVMAAV